MRLFRGFLIALALTATLGLLAVVGAALLYGRNLPDVHRLDPLMRRPAPGGALLRRVVVESEDRRFYQHGALDVGRVARAALTGLARGPLEGGSSVTQQLVKNTLLARYQGARTLERKVREALLAVQVERAYSKDRILTAYLNVIYWGSGGSRDLIGAGDAARAYFGVAPARLDLAQSVYLATLIPSPARYFDYAAQRPLMRALLGRLVQDGVVSGAEASRAWREPLRPAGWRVRYAPGGTLLSAALVNAEAKDVPHTH